MSHSNPPSGGDHIDTRGERWLTMGGVAVGVSLALCGLFFVGSIAANRGFQVDEAEHIHAAYNLDRGLLIYRDFRAPHHPLLYYALSPFVDDEDPVGTLTRCRWVTTSCLVVTLLLIAVAGWRVGGPAGGTAAGLLALWHSTMVERGIEVRPDNPVTCCTMAALVAELSPGSRLKRSMAQAALLSAGALFSRKAVFACLFFGVIWLIHAIRARSPRQVVLPTLTWALPVTMGLAALAVQGNLTEYLQLNVNNAAGVVSRQAAHLKSVDTLAFLLHESRRNVAFVILAGIGWVLAALELRPGGRRQGGAILVAGLATVQLVSLWAIPFAFPYLHVTAIPFWAVLAGFAVARIARASSKRVPAAAVLLVVCSVGLQALTSFPRLLEKASSSRQFQDQILTELQRVTRPEHAVLDLVGLYFRPDGHYSFNMTGNTFSRYLRGGLQPIPDAARERGVMAVVLNYRTLWLQGRDSDFIGSHYVPYDRNILLHGRDLSQLGEGQDIEFEALRTERFRFDGEGSLMVDGRPFTSGELSQGVHRLQRRAGTGQARLILDTPPPVPWPPGPPARLYVNFD